MIPGPRPPRGHDRPSGRDPGRPAPLDPEPPLAPPCDAAVSVTRTPQGWTVVTPTGSSAVEDLVEGMTLADLIAQEHGVRLDPDRTARRSARGPGAGAGDATDPVDARVAALERTVAPLEHALAARVATERAIGVLAERHGTDPRSAFESLRRQARSQGRPVHELAGEVLATLPAQGGPDAVVLTIAVPPIGAPEVAAEGGR